MHVPRVVHACIFFGTRLYRNGLMGQTNVSKSSIALMNDFVLFMSGRISSSVAS